MRESELLSHIARRSADLSRVFPRVLVGPGHDCAAVDLGEPGRPALALLKTDQVIEGRHFRPGTPIDLIARKAVARAVSDLAAAAGQPVAALAAAALPSGYAHADALFDAMAHWARHWSCPLVGGDIGTLGRADAPMVLTVSVVGLPHPVRGPVLRSGAVPGDHVYATGALGGSFDHATSLGRHLTFEPRLAEARALADVLGPSLHAMMDISDGLGRDAARLAAMSGVAIELDLAAVPVHPAAADAMRAIAEGEDYELFFAATGDVPRACPATGTPITRLGRVLAGSGCRVRTADGRTLDASAMGWDHA